MNIDKFSFKIDTNRKYIHFIFFGKRCKLRYNYTLADLLNKFLTICCIPKNSRLKVTRFFSQKYKEKYDLKFYTFNAQELLILFQIYNQFPKNILSVPETIKKIVEENCSLSRIGDGAELSCMINDNPKLASLKQSLLQICSSGTQKNCLVAINNFNVDKEYVSDYYRRAFALLSIKHLQKMFNKVQFTKSSLYGDAYALFFFFNNATEQEYTEKLLYISQIWKNKKILFVINPFSPILQDKKIFKDAQEKAFLFGPTEDAYSKYDEIFSDLTSNYDNSWIIYIEMGAMATVLSYELAKLGYQALDMGDFYKRICKNAP